MTNGELAMIIISWRKNLTRHQKDLVDAFGHWDLETIFVDNSFEDLHRWYDEWKEWHPDPEDFPKAGDKVLAKLEMTGKIFSGTVTDTVQNNNYPGSYVLLKRDDNGEVIECMETVFLFKIVKKS